MARVFEKPHYVDEAFTRLKMFRDADQHVHATVLAISGIDIMLRSELAELTGDVYNSDDQTEDKAYEFGAGKSLDRVLPLLRVAQEAFEKILPKSEDHKVYNDSEGAIALVHDYLSGTISVDRERDKNSLSAEAAAKEAAAYGLMASFVTPQKCIPATEEVKWYRHLSSQYPKLCDMYDLCESWRMAVNSKESRDHLRAVMDGKEILDIEKLRVKVGTFAKFHTHYDTYVVLGISVHRFGDRIYVFDNTVRAEIHDVLYTASQWVLYGANHHHPLAEQLANRGIAYLKNAIGARIKQKSYLGDLGTQIKKSYAVALARYKSAGEGSMDERQVAELSIAAKDACKGEMPWFEILLEYPDELIVDLGTLWNLLPGVDADPRVLAQSLHDKMETPKEYSDDAWQDFIRYSEGVITAHILYERKGQAEGYDWNVPAIQAAALPWVQNCLKGILDYPPDDNHVRLLGTLPWNKQMEFWHFAAKDVTHIAADLDMYETRLKTLTAPRNDGNELLYAMKHGSLLSYKYKPEDIRAAWEVGSPPGDRILMLAAKRENTKGKYKTRDTESADDIQRECLSEGEGNLRRLARMLDGCTSGIGRAKLEHMVNNVIKDMKDTDVLDSMDFDGWSPKAVRSYHMKFQDMLYSFFKTSLRPSRVFDEPTAVMTKACTHVLWKSKDGSVQGFFGAGDTILNSLMCQWSFHREKVKGNFSPESKLRKMTLIDDVLLRLMQFMGDIEAAALAINKNCALLGYNAEIIKTLLSHVKGHFLNRLYSEGQEAITAAKIFSKANREYARQYTTIWDRVDSTFGSYLGASDRGADPVTCYVFAMCRSFANIRQVNQAVGFKSVLETLVYPFMPRAVGGWGVPAYAQWATRESAKTLNSGITVMTTIADLVEESDPEFSNAVYAILNNLADSEVEMRTPMAVAEDPFNVKISGVIDPSIPIRTLFKKASVRAVQCPEFKALMSFETDEGYILGIDSILTMCEYPAPVIAEWASTLPHSVVRTLFSTIESNESVLVFANRREKKTCWKRLKDENRKAVHGLSYLLGSDRNGQAIKVTASEVLSTLQSKLRILDGYIIRDTVVPGVLDSIRQVTGEGSIKVHIPALVHGQMTSDVPDGGVVRSLQSTSIVLNDSAEDSFSDPMYRAYIKMCTISSVVRAYGSDPTPLETFWSQAWLGSKDAVRSPTIIAKGSNPMRLCARISNRNFSVFAFPNAVRTVKVDVSSAISQFEELNILVPFMAVVYTLKAAALMDCRVGGTEGKAIIRHYDFCHAEGLFGQSEFPPKMPDMEFDFNNCVLRGEAVNAFMDRITNVSFKPGETIGDIHDPSITAEISLDGRIGQIMKSRGVAAVPRIISRLAGSMEKISARLSKAKAMPDVVQSRVNLSKRAVAKDIAENALEAEVIGLIFDIATSPVTDQLRDKAKKIIEDNHKFVNRNGLRSALENYISEGDTVMILRAMGGFASDTPKYYSMMKTKYEGQEKNLSLSSVRRYRGHFMAAFMGTISGEAAKELTLSRYLLAIARGFVAGSMSIWRRTHAEYHKELLSAKVNSWVADQAGIDINTRGKITQSLVDIFSSVAPPDLTDLTTVTAGLKWAVTDMEEYMEIDALLPESRKQKRIVEKKPEPPHVFTLGVIEDEGFKLDAAVGSEDLTLMSAHNPDYVEFLKTRGIFDVIVDPDYQEDFEDYLRKHTQGHGGNTDV